METQTCFTTWDKHTLEYNQAVKGCKEEIRAAGDVLPKSKQMTQLSIAGALASCTPYDRKSKQWREMTDVVTYCLAKDMIPIQMVEKEDFKQLVKKLNPRYNFPGKKYFSKDVLAGDVWSMRQQTSS